MLKFIDLWALDYIDLVGTVKKKGPISASFWALFKNAIFE